MGKKSFFILHHDHREFCNPPPLLHSCITSGYLADNVGTSMAFYCVSGVVCLSALSNYLLLPETKKFKAEEMNVVDKRSLGEKVSGELYNTISIWRSIVKDKDLFLITLCHTAYW